ncbi:hypothetical protein DXG03_000623 [Asterophora parasitica]|uniref:Uncharacterized protein n=1 Tax=Asterophora parasitica TaxID=117018 RepID=A0A9P7G471_9AGAR|nr:hypothetical protein DXG03_000623 [Asterophora parasitica]
MDLYRGNNPYPYNDKTTDTEPDPEPTPTPYKTDPNNNTIETTADSMSATTQTTAQPIELKLAPPMPFDGNQSETRHFISKINLYLRHFPLPIKLEQPEQYSKSYGNDKDKKLFYKPKNYVIPKYTPPAHDPDAIDINCLTQEERNVHMKKGLCFDCYQPRHRAVDHKSGSSIPKKTTNPSTNQKAIGTKTYAKIHALLGELEDKEKKKALKQMEDEGF